MSSDSKPPVPSTDHMVTALQLENLRLKSELKRVNLEKVEYLQNVSHQLVAPLNAIKWHIENLTSGRVGVERAKKVLRSIYSQSTIAVHLAKNFALMSNIEGDHTLAALREPLQEVNVFRLLINLADDFQPLGWDKELTIKVVDQTPLASAPDLLAMKPLLSQAFSNIIENAVKYSHPKSEIIIDGSYNKSAEIINVTITNRGIPLPSEDVDRIFERGHRTQEARNQYPAGTGFGLFIARRILEIHEGKISARTVPQGRAEFTVNLPTRALAGKARQRA